MDLTALLVMCFHGLFTTWAIGQATSENLTPRLTQYVHTAWKVRDGEIAAEPTALAQTKDGYLWTGTQAGLLQFDGVRFQMSTIASENGFHDFEVTALYGAEDGGLWVGGKNSLGRLAEGIYRSYGYQGFITQFKSDRKGKTWFSRTRNLDGKGALCSIDGLTVHCFGKQQGQDCAFGNALVDDGANGFWVGWDQLCHWDGTSTTIIPFPKLKDDAGTMVGDLLRKDDGSVVVAIDGSPLRAHPTETVFTLGKEVKVLPSKDNLPGGIDIVALLLARDGSEWVGTRQSGVYHVSTKRTDHYGVNDGLSSDHVNALLQDREGDIWVATTDGLDRFRLPKILTVSRKEGLDVDQVSSVFPSSDGSVWIPTVNGLNLFRNDRVEQIPMRNTGAGKQVLSVFQDSSKKLWIATTTHLLLYEAGKLSIVRRIDGAPLMFPFRVIQDAANNIWVMPLWKKGDADLYRIEGQVAVPVMVDGKGDAREIEPDHESGVWLRLLGDPDLYRFQNGSLTKAAAAPAGSHFSYLLPEPDGSVWALADHGLMRWANGNWKTLDLAAGLPCSSLLQLQFDLKSNLWLLSRCGLQKISSDEIRGWADGSLLHVHPQLFGASDGARVMSTYYLPHSAVASDGKLWFGGDAGVQIVDPASIRTNDQPPPVHIEQLTADGVDYRPGVSLHPLTHNVEIQYTALSLVNPEQVQFRYRLLGADKQWQEAYSRRQAFYQNLKPGTYRFEVIASNNDGVWNTVGDTIGFTVPPAYYQTSWFRILVLIMLLGLVWFLVRLRVRRSAHAVEAMMRERLTERDRIARELHDTLLQGFQSIVLRLHTVWNSIPKSELASTMIADTLTRADAVLKEGRVRVRDLRGGQAEQELSVELTDFIAWHEPSTDVDCSVKVIGQPQDINDAVREDLAAIAKEALINALTHSKAAMIVCELNYGRKALTIVCRDDGIGIESNVLSNGRSDRYGLLGMRERAERVGGRFRIVSTMQAGTIVQLDISSRLAYKRH